MAKAWMGGKKLAYFNLISADKAGFEKKQITNDMIETVINNFMMDLFIAKYLLLDLIFPEGLYVLRTSFLPKD
jgi:hypothetical protein